MKKLIKLIYLIFTALIAYGAAEGVFATSNVIEGVQETYYGLTNQKDKESINSGKILFVENEYMILDNISASMGTQALQIADYTKVMSEGKVAQEISYNNSNLVNKEKNNVMGQNTSTIKNNNKAVDENRNYLSGSKNLQLNQPKNPKYQNVRNNMMIIENIEFSGHALDRMQDRGIPISLVKETIEYGTKIDATGDRTKFYDAKNNVSVILENSNGRVITVEYGK